MTDEALFDKIEAYLNGSLPLEEMEAFEKAISENPALAEQVESQRVAAALLGRLEEKKMQENLARWRMEMEGGDILPKKKKNYRLLGLIGILLVVLFSVWLFRTRGPEKDLSDPLGPLPSVPRDTTKEDQKNPAPDTLSTIKRQQVMALAGSKIQDISSPLVRGTASEDILLKRVDSLLQTKAKDRYFRATNLLLQIPPGHALYGYAQKKLANVLLRQGNARAALKAYRNYAATDPSNEEEHDWNLALYQLANYPEGEAVFRTQLGAILKSPGHTHYRDAKTLQQELRKLGWVW